MAQHYSDSKRETDPHALPDVETFEVTRIDAYNQAQDCAQNRRDDWQRPGWYYWFCFPGCMPDSDPMGPFETEAEALADAREGFEDGEDEDNA